MAENASVEKGYRIQGRVQGVGFRWWTRSQARRLGLHGSVRNCDDGTVEVQVRGPIAAMEQFELLLHEGPEGAEVVSVKEVTKKQMPPDDFAILH